jgi:hypothetical protein
MKTLRNEKGFALLFVLILAAIALVMTLGMLTMVGRGSFVSGQQKRYRTAVEASRGGVEAMLQLIAARGIPLSFTQVDNTGNLAMKMNTTTGSWIGLDNSITINPGNSSTYDMKVDLVTYTAYTKIVDTVQGNSGPDSWPPLEGGCGGAVNTGCGEVIVVSIPYLYTIEVLAQSTTNSTERAKYSVLYQY